MWRALCLLLFALPVWAEPFATAQVADSRATHCDYEDTTTGEAARVLVSVDTVRGLAENGYRVCKFDVAHWLPGSVHAARMRAVIATTGDVSTWTAATLDRPASAQVALHLIPGPSTPPPQPSMPIARVTGANRSAVFDFENNKTIAWPTMAAGYGAALVVSWYSAGQSINTPSGFTKRGSDITFGGSKLSVFTRDCDGSESGNVTIGFTDNSYAGAVLTVLSGSGALTYAGIGSSSTGNSSDAVAPSVASTAGQGVVAAYAVGDPPGTTNSGPSGWTLGDEQSITTNGARTYFKTSTGATGDATWDFTSTRDWAGIQILFNDAGAGGAVAAQPIRAFPMAILMH